MYLKKMLYLESTIILEKAKCHFFFKDGLQQRSTEDASCIHPICANYYYSLSVWSLEDNPPCTVITGELKVNGAMQHYLLNTNRALCQGLTNDV